jgi:CDP-diacylglycerol--serine O-phosphatidyltransferase
VVVRKRRKGIYILPNLFTLAALFGGFYAVVMAMNQRFDMAASACSCAMVLDSLDGRVARMTNTQSAFGEQMDSLSDMVSFGAAPALIAYEWALKGLGRWGWIAAFVYCACAALRLARFNVNTGVVDKRYFQGLPSPAAAALVTGFIWLMNDNLVKGYEVAWPMFAFALFAGLTMVTNVPFYSFKDVSDEEERAVRGHRADRAGHRRHQHRPAGGAVRAVLHLRPVGLRALRLAQGQGHPDQRHQHVHRRAGRARPAPLTSRCDPVLHSRHEPHRAGPTANPPRAESVARAQEHLTQRPVCTSSGPFFFGAAGSPPRPSTIPCPC